MTVQSAQLVLPISIDPDATWAHWVSRLETEHLESAVQQVTGKPDQGVFVWGGAGEGKSHLLQASCAAQSDSVRYIPMDAVLEYPPEAVLEAAEHDSLVVIDDIHLMNGHRIWQEGVFWGCVFGEHLQMLNVLFARSMSLVWSSNAPPRSHF